LAGSWQIRFNQKRSVHRKVVVQDEWSLMTGFTVCSDRVKWKKGRMKCMIGGGGGKYAVCGRRDVGKLERYKRRKCV